MAYLIDLAAAVLGQETCLVQASFLSLSAHLNAKT